MMTEEIIAEANAGLFWSVLLGGGIAGFVLGVVTTLGVWAVLS